MVRRRKIEPLLILIKPHLRQLVIDIADAEGEANLKWSLQAKCTDKFLSVASGAFFFLVMASIKEAQAKSLLFLIHQCCVMFGLAQACFFFGGGGGALNKNRSPFISLTKAHCWFECTSKQSNDLENGRLPSFST